MEVEDNVEGSKETNLGEDVSYESTRRISSLVSSLSLSETNHQRLGFVGHRIARDRSK